MRRLGNDLLGGLIVFVWAAVTLYAWHRADPHSIDPDRVAERAP